MTGSDEKAHRPLTEILESVMKLKVDKIINVSGVTKGGHFLDTQGFIAHNDRVIVLSPLTGSQILTRRAAHGRWKRTLQMVIPVSAVVSKICAAWATITNHAYIRK